MIKGKDAAFLASRQLGKHDKNSYNVTMNQVPYLIQQSGQYLHYIFDFREYFKN